MKPATTRTIVSLLSLAVGLAGGWLIRQNTARSPFAEAKSFPRSAPPRYGLASGNATMNADAPLKEEPTKSMVPVTRASDFRLAARIAALTPEQARRQIAAGFVARDQWLVALLWFRAAADDPAALLSQRAVPAVDPESGQASEPVAPLRGIFGAWLRRDAAAGFEAAQSTPQRLETFIQEWTAHDPAAAAHAVEREEISAEHFDHILRAWSRRSPDAALAWAASADSRRIRGGVSRRGSSATYAPSQAGDEFAEWQGEMRADVLQSLVSTDPARALPQIAALEWGRPWTRDDGSFNALDDHLRIAVDTVAALSPEFAAQFAAGLPQERLTPDLAGSISHALEAARPGAGIAWVQTLTDPVLRDSVALTFLPGSNTPDFAAAVRAVESATPGVRGPAARRVVERWVQLDPGAVHAWLAGPLPEMPARDVTEFRKVFNEHVRKRLPNLVLPSSP